MLPPSSGMASEHAFKTCPPSPTTSTIPDFVKKLFKMLGDTSRPDILTWGVDGKSFVVKDPNEFARLVLPKHFKHSNFASFVRQLNKYDFHKVRNPDDGQRPYGDQAWEFHHPHFSYGREDLLDGIKRKTSIKLPRPPGPPLHKTSSAPDGTRLGELAQQLHIKVQQAEVEQATMHSRMDEMERSSTKTHTLLHSLKQNLGAQESLLTQIMHHLRQQHAPLSAVDERVSALAVATTFAQPPSFPSSTFQTSSTKTTRPAERVTSAISPSSRGKQPSMMTAPGMVRRNTAPIEWSMPPRVLLVDDDSIFRKVSTRLLQMAGCTTDVAVDGLEAINKLNGERYDIVLMDIMMPNLDGISATRNIRRYDTWTPIISMTANTNDQDVREYIMSGMTDILPKPLDHHVLAKLLERYCAHLRLNSSKPPNSKGSSSASFSSSTVTSAPQVMSHNKATTGATIHLASFPDIKAEPQEQQEPQPKKVKISHHEQQHLQHPPLT
ncbi:hypothetical protein BCR43DRAFT_485167 [Syncephalastrum racemosum]|uniref:Transcription factor n=1 Tax=Syncephalastrum racemosum TaxID=13706 RepID=A0A1X2HLY5_SYNRA|nr:hypothetical protein BCR43DRAFT_485167 [Syncephalastrum racemosum]